MSVQQEQRYTVAVAGQACTLTPKAGTESRPNHLGATTLVFNTVAGAAPTEFWDVNSEYLITVHKMTKSA